MLHRVVGFVTALLLLHLPLVGGRVACTTHVRGADVAVSDHGAMSTDNSVGSASDRSDSGGASNTGATQLSLTAEWQGATPDDSGCPAHGTTPACDSMAACAPVVLSPPVTSVSIVAVPTAGIAASHVVAPRTRTTAPELPPPRV